MKIKFLLILLFLLDCQWQYVYAQPNENKGLLAGNFQTTIPAQLYNIILARPTDKSITISILANEDLSGYIEYGFQENKLDKKTAPLVYIAGKTYFIELNNLQPDKNYFYRFSYKKAAAGKEEISKNFIFHTQRSPDASFSFTIQADSHLDENTDTAIYTQTLRNISEENADFLVDLGDTWMDDKYQPDFKESIKQYIAQRYYFGLVGKSTPVYFTLGNHDGEQGQRRKDIAEMLQWATATRKNFYANPLPNGFYGGNDENEQAFGNYYSWQWGNAMFVVLDPFRYSSGNRNPWQRTLGDAQYKWFEKILQQSKAKFKFVFIHNLVGGVDLKGRGRGGAEASNYFEWGGMDSLGKNTFSTNRPEWELPIHDLMVKYKVNILFHGHDHFFAKQDKEGIVYQLVPQPGAARYGNTKMAAEYGYISGIIKNNPGYLRVKISANEARVDYVQSSTDGIHKNKEVLYSYSIKIY